MILNVGQIYKFVLTDAFSALNGSYIVDKIMTWETSLSEDGVDYATVLYTAAGVATTQLATDYVNYQGKLVYKVVSVSGDTTLYFPEALFKDLPDPTVRKYHQYYVSVLLGVFDSAEPLLWIPQEIETLVLNTTGVTAKARLGANPAYDELLTNAEYDAKVAGREVSIAQYSTLSQQLIDANAEITLLKDQIAALQTIVANSKKTT